MLLLTGTHAGMPTRSQDLFKKLYEEVVSSADKANKRLQIWLTNWKSEQVAKLGNRNNQMVVNTETMMNQINDIYQRHNGDARAEFSEKKNHAQ